MTIKKKKTHPLAMSLHKFYVKSSLAINDQNELPKKRRLVSQVDNETNLFWQWLFLSPASTNESLMLELS